MAGETTPELVAAALDGNQDAWSCIVGRFERLVWKAVNMVTANQQHRQDAFARTWLRASQSLGSVRDPERLGAWLSVVATREAIAVARADRAVPQPGDEIAVTIERRAEGTGRRELEPEARLLDRELAAAAKDAFGRLEEGCRELLSLLILNDPPMSYAEIERHLGRPHGWIGPTRLRCLEKLRRDPTLRALLGDGVGVTASG